jgi:hypothetical protein
MTLRLIGTAFRDPPHAPLRRRNTGLAAVVSFYGRVRAQPRSGSGILVRLRNPELAHSAKENLNAIAVRL